MKKICLNCQEIFNARINKTKYCSMKCKNKAQQKRYYDLAPEKECLNCSKKFKIRRATKERVLKSKFCSFKCKCEHQKKSVKFIRRTCERCNTEFKIKKSYFYSQRKTRVFKFCSLRCHNTHEHIEVNCNFCGKLLSLTRSIFNSRKKYYCNMKCMGKDKETSVNVSCAKCKKVFMAEPARLRYYSILFCSNICRLSYQYDNEGENFYKKVNPKYKKLSRKLRESKYYRKWRRWVIDSKKICNNCGSIKNLHVHHSKVPLWKICSDNNYKFFDILKDANFISIENGEVLCRKCHYDKHLLRKITGG